LNGDDYGIRPAEIAERTGDELDRRADEAGIVEPVEHDVAEVAVFEPGTDLAFVELDRPIDPFDAADAEQVGIGQAGRFVDEADFVVHDPNVGVADVVNLAGGTFDDANEHRHLLSHQ
jgi:hypothetical protein